MGRKWSVVALIGLVVGAVTWVSYSCRSSIGTAGTGPISPRDLSTTRSSGTEERHVPIGPIASMTDAERRSFGAEVNDLQARANLGEAAAQRDLSEIYGRCLAIGVSSSSYLQGIEAIAKKKADEESANQLLSAARRLIAECAEVDGGAPVPLVAQKLWLQQAAKGGDLTARVRFEMYYPSESSDYPVPVLLEEALSKGDAAALFDLGQVLGTGRTDLGASYGGALAGDYGAYALSIVACQRGLDCGSESAVMRSICLNTSECNSASYEDFIRDHLVAAGDLESLNARVAAVSTLIPEKH